MANLNAEIAAFLAAPETQTLTAALRLLRRCQTVANAPKIYCFIERRYDTGDVEVIACIAQLDGLTLIACHLSSNDDLAKVDIGIYSQRHHETYAELFPQGYILEWVDQPDQHPVLSKFVHRKGESHE